MVGGDLIRKSGEGSIKGVAVNNYHWSSKRTSLKKRSSKYDVNEVSFLTSKVDALA